MHEHMYEPIQVSVAFLHNKVIPRKFSWNNHVYDIVTLTMVHHEYKGKDKIYYFSVSDGINFFSLAFSTDTLTWTLQEIYTD